MIDLEKEFRTLRLLAKALIIIGAGLSVGGFGAALLMHEKATPKKPAYVAPSEENPEGSESASAASVKKSDKEKLWNSTYGMVLPSALLGVLFLILGAALRWIIRNNIDDGDEPEPSNDLFRAYAEQLMVAEQLKAKKRKRLK